MNFHFGEASKILLKTMPYLLIRSAVYAALGLAAALYIGIVILVGKLFGSGGAVVFVIGIAVLIGLMRLAKQYVLYLVDAGHIAVITEIIRAGSLPEGVSQYRYGREAVTRMFKEVSVLFVVDRMVDGTIRAINGLVVEITDFLPIPGIESLTKVVNSVISFSLTYIDETILSYNLSRKDANIWESARRGVVLYAQNWRPVLTTAAASVVANAVAFVLVFLVLLIPFALLAMATHNETLRLFWFALAFTLAYGFKLAVFKPFFQTSMILAFNHAIRGQEPDPEWENRLEAASEKF
ncbi:MAG: hypothetical protein ABFD98_01835, partial [Syntrophobacteraceae bacterium]